MENEEAEENNLLDLNLFKTSFKKQDVTKQLNYQKWDEARKKKGIKVVRCPICWSYEKTIIIIIINAKFAKKYIVKNA
jgi:hypothetical protein